MTKKVNKKSVTDVQALFNFLYEACNILRGPIGQDGFKDYITPLLYYKRISDVWDEETEQALNESNGDTEYANLPEQHRFIIPKNCHWSDLRQRTENIGSAIIESMKAIERNNPSTLYGVLSTFSKAQMKNNIFEYIETWYRKQRRHSYLNYRTIEEFNSEYFKQNINM